MDEKHDAWRLNEGVWLCDACGAFMADAIVEGEVLPDGKVIYRRLGVVGGGYGVTTSWLPEMFRSQAFSITQPLALFTQRIYVTLITGSSR